MIQPGRKSAASLAVVTKLPGARPAPPKDLTKAQAAVWRATVATKPADWFSRDSWPLLVAFCRHTTNAAALARRIDAMLTVDFAVDPVAAGVANATLKDTMSMHAREVSSLNMCARSMRLTQQSRLKAETAHRANSRANGSSGATSKPWET